MGHNTLGEFEHHVLLAVLRLGAEAYSVPIYRQLEAVLNRDVSLAAVYIALRRLEKRGLVTSTLMNSGAESGHKRRYVRLTPLAMERLEESRRAFLKLWDGVEALIDRS